MKAIVIGMLCACTLLSSSDTLGPNPSMREPVEPEEKITPFKKPEFITKYNELVDSKEAKKVLGTDTPIKYLSHTLFEKWRLAGNLLLSAVNADATFEIPVYANTDKTLIYYATELKKQIAQLSEQASIIMEKYPIYTYKKPLFKKNPKYKEIEDKIPARTAIKGTESILGTISQKASRIKLEVSGIPTHKGVTEGQKKVYNLAADFADKVAALAQKLEREVNGLA